jgi:hypothetical protein
MGQDYYLYLLARTDSRRSPAIISLLTGAFVDAAISSAVELTKEKLQSSIRGWLQRRKEQKELVSNIFGFLRTCDFVGKKDPQGMSDLKALERIISRISISGDFEVENSKNVLSPDLTRNVCAIGGPVSNDFSAFLMKIDTFQLKSLRADYAPSLPFSFNLYLDPRCRTSEGGTPDLRAIRENFRKIEPPLNFSIVSKEGNKEYIPEYERNLKIYTKDYLMLVKTRSLDSMGRGTYGSWNLVVAGCHGYGTEAINLVLEDTASLSKIYEKAGSERGFQAVFEVFVDENNKEPNDTKLCEIEVLSS